MALICVGLFLWIWIDGKLWLARRHKNEMRFLKFLYGVDVAHWVPDLNVYVKFLNETEFAKLGERLSVRESLLLLHNHMAEHVKPQKKSYGTTELETYSPWPKYVVQVGKTGKEVQISGEDRPFLDETADAYMFCNTLDQALDHYRLHRGIGHG